jgi:hypothetical protein
VPELKRVFLLGAATLATVAALGAIVAVTNGHFGETEGDFFATLATAFVAGTTAIAGIACLNRGVRGLGWLGVALAIAGFVLWTEQIWAHHSSSGYWKFLGVVLIWTLVTLAVMEAVLMTRTRRGLEWATIGCAVVAGLVITGMVLRSNGDGWQLFAVFLILTVLGLVLIPILERYAVIDVRERELGTIGGAVVLAVPGRGRSVRIGDREVPLESGEVVVVRER